MSAPGERCVIFTCGGSRLVGIVHGTHAGAAGIGVLVIVGGPQYRVGSHRQFVLMARSLAASGYPVMRFDYRGMGDSEGELLGFEHVADDVQAAIEAFTAAVPSLSHIVLWGLCDGASAAAMQGMADRRMAGMVLVNPWVRTAAGEAKAYVQRYYGRRLLQSSFWKKLLSGRLHVLRAMQEFALTMYRSRGTPARAGDGALPFIERMRRGIAACERPILLLISGRDLTAAEFVTLCAEDAAWSSLVARGNVSRVRLEDADHTFSSRTQLERAGAACREWLDSLRVRLGETAADSTSAGAFLSAKEGTMRCR
jgi:uncharacterized protein